MKRLILFLGLDSLMISYRNIGLDTNLVLLKNTPFLTSFELATLAVVAPLNGIAHRRHFEWLSSRWRDFSGEDEIL